MIHDLLTRSSRSRQKSTRGMPQSKTSQIRCRRGILGKQIAINPGFTRQSDTKKATHPAEEIWWSANNGPNNAQMYRLNVFADSSKRFWWRADGRRHEVAPVGARRRSPGFSRSHSSYKSTRPVSVPFRGKRFEVLNMGFENVVRVPDSDKACDLVLRKASATLSCMSFVPHNDTVQSVVQNVGLKTGDKEQHRAPLPCAIETTSGRVKQIATKR